MSMVFVSPLVLQVAVAEIIITGEGPVIAKSEPLAAMELHRIASGKFREIVVGEQVTGPVVPIGSAGCAEIIKDVFVPAATILLQLPIKLLPSAPLTTCTW